jgi:hypothetical protein
MNPCLLREGFLAQTSLDPQVADHDPERERPFLTACHDP